MKCNKFGELLTLQEQNQFSDVVWAYKKNEMAVLEHLNFSHWAKTKIFKTKIFNSVLK